ncbi:MULTISPECIES: hypothetical protein [unclassified Spiroplasma]|uniref:hypothetical protein n=1 Tax=unclassified Spiroplasma TaxID=2637901 RepID=UPI0030CFDA34
MGENIKKGHSKGCHNNCRIHYNPDFFSYYQYPYPYPPFYPYPTPPSGVQYTLPQNLYPPLLSQYNYSPVIQQPKPLQQQSPAMVNPTPPYQNINQTVNPSSLPNLGPENDMRNMSSYHNRYDYRNQQYLDDPYSPYYNSRPFAKESNYNDFRRPVGPLSAEDEYNWAIHISKILDEFISSDRNQPKTSGGEYKELKNTLDTSLRHLKEAEALNKTLIEAWEKRNEKQESRSTVTSSETIILPELPLTTEQEEVIQNEPPTILNAENRSEVKDVIEPAGKAKIDSLSENNVFDLFNFDDDFDSHFDDEQDDEHSFFFDTAEFNDPTPPIVNKAENDDNFDNNFTENLHDFFDTNAPVIDLDPTKVEPMIDDETEESFKNSFVKGVVDTSPGLGTYKNYTIKTLMGKIQAQEIYDKIFDEFGHSKMDQFEVMNEFGLTQKQYDKLIDNFYQVKKNWNKKIDEKQIRVVIRSRFNVKTFWISMTIIGIILLLVGVIVILYFTVPIVANTIDMIINKIRNLF